MVPSLLKMVLMNSVDIVVDPLDDPFVSKTEETMVFQVYYKVFMYLDSDNVCRLDDFSRNLQIIG